MEAIGKEKKNAICRYQIMSSGYSGWLTREDVINVMENFLQYDVIVEDYPNIERIQMWYALRLRCSKSGEPTHDNLYYFRDKETRDLIREYWTQE